MASRIDFSPLANPTLNAPLAVKILGSYDGFLQAELDRSTQFRGHRFSLLVLAEYTVLCKTNQLMDPAEAARPNWARDNFHRSPLNRIVAVETVFSKIVIDPRREYGDMLTQICALKIGLQRARIYTPTAAGAPVLVGGAALGAGAISRGHVPIARGGALAAQPPSFPTIRVPVGRATGAHVVVGGAAATGAPVSRGPAAGSNVGVGSRR